MASMIMKRCNACSRNACGGVVRRLSTMKSSVFHQAFPVALPSALITAVLTMCVHGWGGRGQLESFEWFRKEDSVLQESHAFSGFSFLVGFLIVFRTSQSYARWWEGCTALNKMHAEWFDSASALIAFTKSSTAPEKEVHDFWNILIRLFSLLNAMALADVEDCCGSGANTIRAFHLPLLDIAGLDRSSLETLFRCDSKTELIMSWIQQIVVDSLHSGLINTPPPIVSRAFQTLANGMVEFHEAMKITWVPFPFPYSQACDFLLVLHWLLLPFVMSVWVPSPFFSFIFAFVQVLILWSLTFIANELENPFGGDANDLDVRQLQIEFNYQLLLLLHPGTLALPNLKEDAEPYHENHHVSLDHGKNSQLAARTMATFDVKSRAVRAKSLYDVLSNDGFAAGDDIVRRSCRDSDRNSDSTVTSTIQVGQRSGWIPEESNDMFQSKVSKGSAIGSDSFSLNSPELTGWVLRSRSRRPGEQSQMIHSASVGSLGQASAALSSESGTWSLVGLGLKQSVSSSVAPHGMSRKHSPEDEAQVECIDLPPPPARAPVLDTSNATAVLPGTCS